MTACTASNQAKLCPQRRSIYTDDETWAKLLKLGNGNASAGIREAVRRTEERE